MKMRFLLDENLTPRIKASVLRWEPAIDIERVGDPGMPPLATSDPEILQYLAACQRALITDNRRTMPVHAKHYLSKESHHWGIFLVRPKTPIRLLTEEIYLLWEASEAEEWIDLIRFIPF